MCNVGVSVLAVNHLAQMSSLCRSSVALLSLLFHFHQETPLDWATRRGREAVVAYLKRAADPKMLKVYETVPLRIVVVSSREALH